MKTQDMESLRKYHSTKTQTELHVLSQDNINREFISYENINMEPASSVNEKIAPQIH